MKRYRFWLKIDNKVVATFDLPEERAEKFAEFVGLPFPGPLSMRSSFKDNFELIVKEVDQETEKPIVTLQP